jgi:hypothetical protein
VSSGPTTVEFIASVVVAGLLGPALAALATKWADTRRFKHEDDLKASDFEQQRKLKASDDLIARIDDVAVALDELFAACNAMRYAFISLGETDLEAVRPDYVAAKDASKRALAAIARLRMRPHADSDLVEKAEAAAESLHEAVDHVRKTFAWANAGAKADIRRLQVEQAELDMPVAESIEAGYGHTKEYWALARAGIARLLVSDSPLASS